MAHGRCKSYIHGTVCNSPILSLVRQLPSLFDIIYLIASSFAFKREASALHRPFCLSGFNFYISGNFFPTARVLIGYFKVTWHLTIKLFLAKISEQIYDVREWDCAVTRESWPTSVVTARFNEFPELQNFQLYNKTLKYWSLGKQLILFPENLHVSRGEARGKYWLDSRETNQQIIIGNPIMVSWQN